MIIVLSEAENEAVEKAIAGKHFTPSFDWNHLPEVDGPNGYDVRLNVVAYLKVIEYHRLNWGPASSNPHIEFVVGEDRVHLGTNICAAKVRASREAVKKVRDEIRCIKARRRKS